MTRFFQSHLLDSSRLHPALVFPSPFFFPSVAGKGWPPDLLTSLGVPMCPSFPEANNGRRAGSTRVVASFCSLFSTADPNIVDKNRLIYIFLLLRCCCFFSPSLPRRGKYQKIQQLGRPGLASSFFPFEEWPIIKNNRKERCRPAQFFSFFPPSPWNWTDHFSDMMRG